MSKLQPSSRELFQKVLPELLTKHGVANRMAGPRIEKVVLNMGVGRAMADGQILTIVAEHLSLIAGQRAVITKSRKSIANFRSRIGAKIGCSVTLRGAQMWAFLDKLINLAIPRIKDFRGISPKGFDGRGNFNMGLREQALFHEVVLDKLDHNQGLHITICVRNSNDAISLDLLKALRFPFREAAAAAAKAAK